jgi:hypothetical protein
VPQAAVRTNFNQAADVLVDFPAEVAFGQIFAVYNFANPIHLNLVQFIHPWGHIRINSGLLQYFRGNYGTHPINAAEGDVRSLAVGYVNASYSNHKLILLNSR